MTDKSATTTPRHVRLTDLRATTRLVTSATLGTIRIAEGVHQSVWRTLGAPGGAQPDRTRGLTGLVYRCVNGISQAVGTGLDAALARLEPLLGAMDAASPDSPQRLAVLAALNGVMGDRLLADGNPLALPMTLQHGGKSFAPDAPPPAHAVNGKILLLVHGLCMNDLHWQTCEKNSDGSLQPGLDHGQALARAQGFTPIYLRYNTGRHIADNGRELSALLQRLLASWPVPVHELVVVAHSMGGLVIRSAIDQAQRAGSHWTGLLRSIVFLGTPHHGAPLERAGSWVDQLLEASPYAAPFARLARLRSSGITDLRHGNLGEAHRAGERRFARQQSAPTHLPLPSGVRCLAIAATLASRRGAWADRLLGDGLVPLHSALGQHDDRARCLAFDTGCRHIVYRTGHLQLLGEAAVARRVAAWLAGPGT